MSVEVPSQIVCSNEPEACEQMVPAASQPPSHGASISSSTARHWGARLPGAEAGIAFVCMSLICAHKVAGVIVPPIDGVGYGWAMGGL